MHCMANVYPSQYLNPAVILLILNFLGGCKFKIQNSQYHIATNLTLYVDLLYVYIYTVFLIHLSLFTAIVNKTSDSQFMHKRIKDRQLQLCIFIYIYT